MSKKIALIFPGQGAQAVGMGRELAARYPAAANLFRQADETFHRRRRPNRNHHNLSNSSK